MYGVFGKINPKKKDWPSKRAVTLRRIVDGNTASVYKDIEQLRRNLIEAKISAVEIKQLELALTSETLNKLLCSEAKDINSVVINNALFSIENCGITDVDARCIMEDLLYSINIDSVLKNYSDVKESVVRKTTTKYIPPQIYRERLKEIMTFVSSEDNEKLSNEVQEEINMYAECNVGEANYILALMYNKGIGVKEDSNLANTYARKAASQGYPSAYALLGDIQYDNNRFDEAYAYYSKPGAIALDKERCDRVDNLLKSKNFANRVCASLGIIYAILVATMLLVNGISLSGSHPVLLSVFITLMAIIMGYIIYTHYKKPLRDMRHWGVVFLIVFTLYLVIALA